jgi:hypothetical protein
LSSAATLIQVALLVPFAVGGAAKVALPYERFVQLPFQGWADDFQASHVRSIGLLEVAAAFASGVSLVWASLIGLTVAGSVAMALVMAGAMATHLVAMSI